MFLKNIVKAGLRSAGYEIRRIPDHLGLDAFRDIRTLTVSPKRPVIFDVGANMGQTIASFRGIFDNPVIHSFEPSRSTFEQLTRSTAGIPELHLNQIALGATVTTGTLIENSRPDMTSLLEPGPACRTPVKGTQPVEVSTVDAYAADHGINHIDVLKSDTQGYDLEVMKGAQKLMSAGRIHLIYLELIFSDMYRGLAQLDESYRFLVDHGYQLISFYKMYHREGRAAWTDALFIHPEYQRN